jgi:hypothetical protein
MIGLIEGRAKVVGADSAIEFAAGQFCLKPACIDRLEFEALAPAILVQVRPG